MKQGRTRDITAELPALEYDSLKVFLGGASQWIDRALPHYLPHAEPAGFLYDPARDYPLRGGKRFRPALLLLACAMAGGDPKIGLPSAIALELFQAFALVHDDIEDGSLIRRGKPALHHLHGIPLSINAGDLLYGLVYEALLDNELLLGPARTIGILREFAEVFRRTFEGQAFDIGWIRSGHMPDRKEFETMIRLKTAWYSGRGPCRIGAGIAGASQDLIDALGDYGEHLGLGFQVRDDLLNLTEDSAGSSPMASGGGYGKERGGDIAEGKRTLIVIEMLERLPAAEARRVGEILMLPPDRTSAADIDWTIAAAERCGALDAAGERCRAHGAAALAVLPRMPRNPQREILAELANFLTQERNA